MEQKHVLLSALSVGVGLGVGLGLSTGQKLVGWNGVSDEISEEQIVHELKSIVDGKDTNVTFEDFPYYLCKKVQIMLINAGYVYLKQDLSQHMKFLPPEYRAILLSGPAELYHQTLAKALANYFGSKLLLLDITDFSLKMQRKYGCPRKEPYLKRSIYDMTVEQVSGLLGSLSILSSTDKIIGTMRRQNSGNENSFGPHKFLCRNASNVSDSSTSQNGSSDSDPFKHRSRFCFDEKLFVQSLYKVLVSISETGSIILYIKDVDKLLLRSPRFYNLFQKLIKKLSGSVLVLGSKVDSEDDDTEDDDKLTLLFPYGVSIEPPQDEAPLKTWKSKLEENEKKIQFQDGRNYIAEVLAAKDIDCDDLDSICHADITQLHDDIEVIVMLAISKHLMDTKHPQYRNGKLVISAKSLSHVLTLFTEGESETKSKDSNKDVPPDNEFERRIRAELVPANEMAVTFADIGALDDVKESLQEAVMLPFRRPDLFKGGLLKPYRGILLFGPPGTGKTMLAKAIAKEAGASFINISISTITSKWYGDDEKTVRALFSLAAKVAPTIIFIDEVDGMLGKRSSYSEHEAMRKVKNEFMTHWDGLLSKPSARILVLAATNRPFDLDEAIVRRFERRIMVGLPSAENREKILKTLLAKEKCGDIDFKELSAMTEGYTGSDLKNLCTTAAYRPVRELLQQEMLKEKEKKKEAEVKSSENGSTSKEDKKEQDKKMEAEVQSSGNASNAIENKEEQLIPLRPLNMDDMRQAKSQVAASFAADGSMTGQLQEWNDLYGEGGSRTKQQLTYFL